MVSKIKSPLFVVLFTVFLDLVGFGILIPVIPQLLANPRSEYFLLPAGMTLNDGYILLGFLTAVFPLAQFFATPILGQLSDKYGRKKVLAISLFGTFLSYIIFAIGIITKSIPLLFFARAFDGITGGNISVAQAAIADITPPEKRARNFGLIGAAFGLGFILGPYIGGKLSDPAVVSWFNATTPFWFAAILSIINVGLMLVIFPETNKNIQRSLAITWNKSIGNIIKAANNKKLRVLFLTSFLFTGGFTFFTTFASVFFINQFHFTQGNIGDFFSYIGLWIAFTQAFITRRVTAKYSEQNIVKVALFATGIGIFMYLLPFAAAELGLTIDGNVLVHIPFYAVFIVPFFAIANGLSQAASIALVSRSAQADVQGEVLGISSSVQALGQAIPAAISGYIAAKLSPETPMLVSALIIILAGIVFNLLYKPSSEKYDYDKSAIVTSH